MSPSTPPRPFGKGQLGEPGSSPNSADVSQAPPNQAAPRRDIRSTGRLRSRPMAQKSAGSRLMTPASPKNCMMRSANAAPLNPSALCGMAPLALEKLGSATFHVARAAMASARPARITRPMTNLICRRTSSPSKVLWEGTPDESEEEPDCMGTQCPNRVLGLLKSPSSANLTGAGLIRH